MTNAKGGANALKGLGMLVCIAIICLCVWYMLPDWLARPNSEATPSQYQDAANTPKASDDAYSSEAGKCPAMTMSVARALADGKLTAREAHDLRNEVIVLKEKASESSAKNMALRRVGQKPTEKEIDCPYGTLLFR